MVTSRRQALLLLLWSLDDYRPGPQLTRPFATRGLAPAERRPCPDCGHSETPGWQVDRWKRRSPCETCGGKPEPSGKHDQWLTKDGGRGWVQVDPMDADRAPVRTAGVDALPTRPARVVTCDACDGYGVGGAHLDEQGREFRERCRYCAGSGKRTVTVFDLELERERGQESLGLVAAIDRRDTAGSYHELEEALAVLPPGWRRIVDTVHVRRERREHELDQVAQARLAAALAALDFLLPERIRVPAAVRHAWRLEQQRRHRTLAIGRSSTPERLAQRDREIRKLARQNRPTQWIAAEYGLSVATVGRVLAGDPEPAAGG